MLRTGTVRMLLTRVFRNMPETGAQLTFNIGSVDTFRQDLDKVTAESGNKVVLVYENRENSWTSILLQMLPWIIIIGGWFFLMEPHVAGGPEAVLAVL